MNLFYLDKNDAIICKFMNNINIDLACIFIIIKDFSLKINQKKKFDFEDINKVKSQYTVIKLKENLYELRHYYENEEYQSLFLYDKIILKYLDKKYDIFCDVQVNYLIKNVLNLKDYHFFMKDEAKGFNVDLNNFINYPGKTIEIQLNKSDKYDYIFNRNKNGAKKLFNLTLNYDYMFENHEKDEFVYFGDGRDQFHNELKTIYENSDQKFKYYCGQCGIGKTVSLLDFRYKRNYILYLNMSLLFKKQWDLNNFYQVLKNELIYYFKNKKDYDNFIEAYKVELFPSSMGNLEFKKFGFNIFQKIIKQLLICAEEKGTKIMAIIDQYKKKYDNDNSLTNFLEKLTENNYFKFICCSSTNEEDVRDNIYRSIFEKNQNNKKYISIKNLIKIDLNNLSENQKIVFEKFGFSPKYYYRIKTTQDDQLNSLIDALKKEIYEEIKISIKKLKIENQISYGLLQIMYNIGKDLDKLKLKSLFQYIFLKFLLIEPKKEQNFIDFWEMKEDIFTLNYSFPMLKYIFIMILKEYKKIQYRQQLIECNNAEEGYILEHLVYLSLDEGENPFFEKLKIHNSYEIDQVFQCSKLYIDNFTINKNKLQLNCSKEEYINSLFKRGKNYHLFQHHENGPHFDGALLISDIKNDGNKDDDALLRENNNINLNEEEDLDDGKKEEDMSKNMKNEENKTKKKINKQKKNDYSSKKYFNLIIYQSTKKKEKNRYIFNRIL